MQPNLTEGIGHSTAQCWVGYQKENILYKTINFPWILYGISSLVQIKANGQSLVLGDLNPTPKA